MVALKTAKGFAKLGFAKPLFPWPSIKVEVFDQPRLMLVVPIQEVSKLYTNFCVVLAEQSAAQRDFWINLKAGPIILAIVRVGV